MPSDPTQRIANWDAGYDTAAIKSKVDKKRPDMLTRANTAFVSQYTRDTEVKQTLDAAGVSVIQYPFYLAFGREMWRLQRQDLSGESLAKEAVVLITKWTARGLTQAVLQAIRTDVFNVAAPVAP